MITLQIAFFAFGALLLLIGLLGKVQFQQFAGEATSKIIRIVAGLIGVVLICLSGSSYISDRYQSRQSPQLVVQNTPEPEPTIAPTKSVGSPVISTPQQSPVREESPSPTPTTDATPVVRTPTPPPSRIRYIDQVKVELLNSLIVGDELQFKFKIVNEGPSDIRLVLFGTDLYGKSRLIGGGQSFPASNVTVGGTSGHGGVETKLNSGVPFNAIVSFRAVPTNLSAIDLLEIYYSDGNLMPQGSIQFKDIVLK